MYWFCHTSTWIRHRYTRVPHPEPPSSSVPPSPWVISVHQPQTSSIMHWTWTGDSFHIWYYTCFNAILPNHSTLSLSHRVQNKTTDFHQTPVGKWHGIKLNSALRNLALELTIIILMFFKMLLHLLSNQMSSAIQLWQALCCSLIWWSWDSEKFKGLAQHEIEMLPRFLWWLTHKFENVLLTTFMEIQRTIQNVAI